MASQRQQAKGAGSRQLWFSPPGDEENRRRALTRDRVAAEALAIISASGAAARACAPSPPASAWFPPRCTATSAARSSFTTSWTEQVTALAHQLRTVLDDHPGIAALLKTCDPAHSLTLPAREAALAVRLMYDHTGFALIEATGNPGQALAVLDDHPATLSGSPTPTLSTPGTPVGGMALPAAAALPRQWRHAEEAARLPDAQACRSTGSARITSALAMTQRPRIAAAMRASPSRTPITQRE